ncbi:MAG: Gx transporter family protein [Lachnospiraceae bacterium]|nr:Gx transporter family protein [Lachnospiraceae bacterium]
MIRKKVPFYGLFLALALILSYIESLLPLPFGVPGMKLGLANLMMLLMLALVSPWEAVLLNLGRILLVGFLFGNAASIAYSLGGAFLSFCCMWLLYRTKWFSIVTVSIVGGVAHNLGQLFVAWSLLGGIRLYWYAPPLMACGAVTGMLIGIGAAELIPRLSVFLRTEI